MQVPGAVLSVYYAASGDGRMQRRCYWRVREAEEKAAAERAALAATSACGASGAAGPCAEACAACATGAGSTGTAGAEEAGMTLDSDDFGDHTATPSVSSSAALPPSTCPVVLPSLASPTSTQPQSDGAGQLAGAAQAGPDAADAAADAGAGSAAAGPKPASDPSGAAAPAAATANGPANSTQCDKSGSSGCEAAEQPPLHDLYDLVVVSGL